MQNVRALTVCQPWATLIALGYKKMETRSKGFSWRGPLYIHAAKAFHYWQKELCMDKPISDILEVEGLAKETPNGTPFWVFPLGAVVAVGRIAATHEVDSIKDTLTDQERALGDYRSGRKALELVDVTPVIPSVYCKGQQGLWIPSDEVIEKVRKEAKDDTFS